jgi:hypothetical protein
LIILVAKAASDALNEQKGLAGSMKRQAIERLDGDDQRRIVLSKDS